MADDTRVCKACGALKLLTDFYGVGGEYRSYTCKECKLKAIRKPPASTGHPCAQCGAPTPPHATKPAKSRKYCSRSCAKLAANLARGNRYRFRQYGITQEQYDAMFESQGRRCAICASTTASARTEAWHIDHCHETNVVRGILCANCNMGLGQMKDDPVRLRSAADYLERSAARSAS